MTSHCISRLMACISPVQSESNGSSSTLEVYPPCVDDTTDLIPADRASALSRTVSTRVFVCVPSGVKI